MSCRAWEELLQRQLDGEIAAGVLETHLAHCPDCIAADPGIRRLLTGLPLLRPPQPPPDLHDRLTARVLADFGPRRSGPGSFRHSGSPRRSLVSGILALAAALLVTLGLWAWRRTPESLPLPEPRPDLRARVESDPVPVPEPERPASEPLRRSITEAGTAVVALTARTASETVDRTSTLWPLVSQTGLEPLSPLTAPLDPPLEPFREATSGVTSGLAPVADSARRAVGLFLRDLPMGGIPSDKKPG